MSSLSLSCPQCGSQFSIKPSEKNKRIFCSKSCCGKNLTGNKNPNYKNVALKTCLYCSISFRSYSKTRKFCSRKCHGLHRSALVKARPKKITRPRAPRPQTVRPYARCKSCKTLFPIALKKISRVNYCSMTCRVSHLQQQSPKPPEMRFISCKGCHQKFPIRKKQRRRLCDNCLPTYWKTRLHGSPLKSCKVCGADFKPKSGYRMITCSPECDRKWKSIRQRGEKSHLWQGGKTKESSLFRNTLDYQIWRSAVFTRDDFTCQMCRNKGGKLAAHHIKLFSQNRHLALEVSNGITLCWGCHRSIKGKEKEFEKLFVEIIRATTQLSPAQKELEAEGSIIVVRSIGDAISAVHNLDKETP